MGHVQQRDRREVQRPVLAGESRVVPVRGGEWPAAHAADTQHVGTLLGKLGNINDDLDIYINTYILIVIEVVRRLSRYHESHQHF